MDEIKQMKVPRQVKEFATQHGFNSVLFAGTLDGASVYSVGVIGNDGIPVPTGMPTYILLKGGEQTIVSGKEGLDLLEYCAGVVSTIDEVAAKVAEKNLLEEIGSDAKTIEELGKNFEDKINEYGIEELLIRYYTNYLYEHLSIDFYEKLIEEKGRLATDNFYTQLKDFLFEKVKNVSRHRDISKIDWAAKDGEDLVKNIFNDTLKEFEGYES